MPRATYQPAPTCSFSCFSITITLQTMSITGVAVATQRMRTLFRMGCDIWQFFLFAVAIPPRRLPAELIDFAKATPRLRCGSAAVWRHVRGEAASSGSAVAKPQFRRGHRVASPRLFCGIAAVTICGFTAAEPRCRRGFATASPWLGPGIAEAAQ